MAALNLDVPLRIKRILQARADRLGLTMDALLEPQLRAIARQEIADEDAIMSLEPTIEQIEERARLAKVARGEV
jgi:phosphoenolpyruvate-protein kinase (PTS system EI component)